MSQQTSAPSPKKRSAPDAHAAASRAVITRGSENWVPTKLLKSDPADAQQDVGAEVHLGRAPVDSHINTGHANIDQVLDEASPNDSNYANGDDDGGGPDGNGEDNDDDDGEAEDNDSEDNKDDDDNDNDNEDNDGDLDDEVDENDDEDDDDNDHDNDHDEDDDDDDHDDDDDDDDDDEDEDEDDDDDDDDIEGDDDENEAEDGHNGNSKTERKSKKNRNNGDNVDTDESNNEGDDGDNDDNEDHDSAEDVIQLNVDGAIPESELPPCDPSSLRASEKAAFTAFAAEVIFSPNGAQRGRSNDDYAEDLDEYVRNARFLLAEHKTYSPDEIVALEEQRIEVVVRSAFEEPHPAVSTVVEELHAHLDATGSQGAVAAGLTATGASSESQPGPAPATSRQTSNSLCKPVVPSERNLQSSPLKCGDTTAMMTCDAADPSEDGGLVLRTYVTESATGQTINHVRPHDIWQRAIPEMTFLNLLALVGYDTSTALIVLEIILSCESVGEPLPAAIALIEKRLVCRQIFDEKPWTVDDEKEFQLQFFKYRLQFPKIYKAMAAGAKAQAAAGHSPVSPRQPYSVREVIRHFHYVWMRPQSLNGGLAQAKRRRGRRGVDGIMRSLLPWHFDKRSARGQYKAFLGGPIEQHVQKCSRCTFNNCSVEPLEHCRLCGYSFQTQGNRRSRRRRKKNTSRFDADDSEENGNDDANFRLPGDDPRLERSAHRLFSALPHPMLESFVEEFLARVQMHLESEPAGTQYNRHTKLDDFAQILNDYVDGSLPTSVAESALRELLDGAEDELLVKDFDFLLQTVWHINIDRPQRKRTGDRNESSVESGASEAGGLTGQKPR